ncbi:hypothetical protein HII31_07221 [Pseudocercospora fuligena]|uniref:Uncharacterized protein n=1 Tax=Pseudocercospora fuligena TaxID=685502 RepID=A0A8H6RHW1_9PEZI|nr:hypothetical protein HII31_07221 [Pseudocercospora fuligena]
MQWILALFQLAALGGALAGPNLPGRQLPYNKKCARDGCLGSVIGKGKGLADCQSYFKTTVTPNNDEHHHRDFNVDSNIDRQHLCHHYRNRDFYCHVYVHRNDHAYERRWTKQAQRRSSRRARHSSVHEDSYGHTILRWLVCWTRQVQQCMLVSGSNCIYFYDLCADKHSCSNYHNYQCGNLDCEKYFHNLNYCDEYSDSDSYMSAQFQTR